MILTLFQCHRILIKLLQQNLCKPLHFITSNFKKLGTKCMFGSTYREIKFDSIGVEQHIFSNPVNNPNQGIVTASINVNL